MSFAAGGGPAELQTRVAVTVGVSGHRSFADERTKAAVMQTCVTILSAIGDAVCAARAGGYEACRDETPIVRLLSPLAEGTDRLVAHALQRAARLPRGEACFEPVLAVVLPFSAGEYRKDFNAPGGKPDPTSIEEFDELLASAGSRVCVLPGQRGSRDERLRAYEAAGRFVRDHSDVMIIVYDKTRDQSRGGTRQMHDEALAEGVPVLLIDPEKPETYSVLVKQKDLRGGNIASIVRGILRLPPAAESGDHRRPESNAFDNRSERLEQFLARVYRIPWRLLLAVSTPFRHGPSRAQSPGRIDPEANTDRPPDPLETPYRHAHRLAARYGALHRGAYLINSFLGASAVTCALLALADRAREIAWGVTEAAILIAMVLNFWASRHFNWLRRFIDWRFLAEELRQARVLHSIGMVPPTARPVVLQSSENPNHTWMDRCFRNWIRQVGPASGALVPSVWITTIRSKWIVGQAAYHEDRARTLEGAERMLHVVAYACFIMAFLGCAGHLVHYIAPRHPFSEWLHERTLWLTFLAAGMPAWGAASHATAVHGEFLRLVERSKDVGERLESAGREFDRLEGQSPVSLADLRTETLAIAQLMLDEVTDWHIVHRGPGFIPG